MLRRDGSSWMVMLAAAAVFFYGGLLSRPEHSSPQQRAASAVASLNIPPHKSNVLLQNRSAGNRFPVEGSSGRASVGDALPGMTGPGFLALRAAQRHSSAVDAVAEHVAAAADAVPAQRRKRGKIDLPGPPAENAAVRRRKRGIAAPAFQPGTGINLLIQADRETVRRLRLAEKSIQNKQFVQAISLLQRVLDREKDAFYYPDPEKRDVLRSVRLAAQQMIAGLPEKGRELYELKYGGTARTLSDEAGKKGRLSGLQKVVRRYFHTQAGYEAMYQLGLLHLDRGQPLAAALCFSRLQKTSRAAEKWGPSLGLHLAVAWRRADWPKKAEEALQRVLKQAAGEKLRVAGRVLPRFATTAEALQWLNRHLDAGPPRGSGRAEWALFRGDAARNGVGTLPIVADRIRWRVSSITDPLEASLAPSERIASENIKALKKVIASLMTTNRQQKTPALPRLHPLLVNGELIVRTTDGVRALSLKEGSWLWKGPTDIFLERMLTSDGAAPVPAPSGLLTALLKQRLWADLTWGTLSSDGRCVYCIEETGYALPTYDPRTRQRTVPADYNRLLACDATTGRILWEAGGPENTLQPAPLAGTWFLGAPLPLGQQLYCLTEVRGEIRLLVLEPHDDGSGPRGRHWFDVVWSQPLVGTTLRISRDFRRRTSAATVSYADGILLCQTGTGYVIAVDLTSRTLLWAFRHVTVSPRPPRPFPRPVPPPRRGSTWEDGTVTIAEGKALLTPPGSNELLCLNLLDGAVLWKAKREDGRYIVGVLNGTVFIAGNRSVRALKLTDGKEAWKKTTPLPALSGRGLLAVGKAGGRLFLPAGTAGIAVVDATTGDLLGTQPLPGQRVPGNLMLWNGTLISQEPDGLTAFPLPQPGRQTAAATK